MKKTTCVLLVTAIFSSFLVPKVFAATKQKELLSHKKALELQIKFGGKRALTNKMRNQVWQSFRQKIAADQKKEVLALFLPTLGHFSEYGDNRRRLFPMVFRSIGEPAVKPLINALKNKVTVADAFSCLSAMGSGPVQDLGKELSSPDREFRLTVLKLLARMNISRYAKEIIPVLMKDFAKRDLPERLAILRVFLHHRGVPGEYLPALEGKLKTTKDISEQIFLLRLLGFGGPASAKFADTAITFLRSHSTSVRAAAIGALGLMRTDKPQAIEALQKIITTDGEDFFLVQKALNALATMGDAGRQVLIKMLGNKNTDVAYQAALSLTQKKVIADKKMFASTMKLLNQALSDKNSRIRRFALFALARIGRSAAGVAGNIEKLLKDKDEHIRTNALEALSRILPADQALKLIEPLLNDSSDRVAFAAACAVANLVKDDGRRDKLLAGAAKRFAWKPHQTEKIFKGYNKTELAKYLKGGPLAGLKLPLYQGQHGEKPGYPGCIPNLIMNAKGKWVPQGMAAEVQLYPGSVEHWRGYWFKYCPQRSFYDGQSLLKNWQAPDIPGSEKTEVADYAEPVYWVPRFSPPEPTGKFRKPVPVIKCKVRKPVFKLDFGELAAGLYTVRIIGAVAEKKPRVFLEPLYISLKVNDGLKGESHTYRKRCGYVDQFYGIAEISFHAPEKRRYHGEVYVAKGSKVELLLHNIELHDALAGTVRKAIKHEPTAAKVPEKLDFRTRLLTEERLARDANIWRTMPPINKQIGYYRSMLSKHHFQSPRDVVRFGQDGKSLEEIKEKYGTWRKANYPVFLRNDKLGLVYTYADLAAGRPLPDPYPFKDDGAGLYQADPNKPDQGQAFIPVAEAVGPIVRFYGMADQRKNCDNWVKKGNFDQARAEAMRLIRIAYRCPIIETSHSLHNVTSNPAVYGRDSACRRRAMQPQLTWLTQYPTYNRPLFSYDKLFSFIDGNQRLADSVGRFVPWVKTPKDVIKLLDSYLVQTVAKRILRYNYYTSNSSMQIANTALVMDNPALTAPWIDWLFSETFIYPLGLEGVQNLNVTSSGRSGCSYIGSSFYAAGEGAASRAMNVEKYLKTGIFPQKYDLRRNDKYPKAWSHLYWQDDIVVGGHDFMRIGDVTGAERTAFTTFRAIKNYAPVGWKWTKDPKFAWIIKNVKGRTNESDAEWQAIEKAAATVKRAPWLDKRSRQVYNWGGVLETGLQNDDYRFRNAVYVRTGLGFGHHHSDSLDLQVVSHGLPMTVDGGQRPGYSSPGDRSSKVHNSVVIDNDGSYLQSWVNTIDDTAGVRYLEAEGWRDNAKTYRRQVALIDVDQGRGAVKLPPEKQLFGAKLATDGIEPANAYVFDVFRVSGGFNHTYCFHGPVSDEVKTNALNSKAVKIPEKEAERNAEQNFLASFRRAPDQLKAGDAAAVTEAVWRYARTGVGSESRHANYDPASPRKYLKLTVFDTKGMRVLRGRGICHARNYNLDHVFIRHSSKDGKKMLDSVFAAIIEPYAGKSVLVSKRLLKVDHNDENAAKAVAIEVKTVNGHTDILFADGQKRKSRTVGNMKLNAQFAFVSTDKNGLRLATLSGGLQLRTSQLEIGAAPEFWSGKIIKVDYDKKQMTIDSVWPQNIKGEVFDIIAPGRKTSYTIKSVQVKDGKSIITVTQGADYYRSSIKKISGNIVTCSLKPTLRVKGLKQGFTVSNADNSKFWYADLVGDSSWMLKGAPVNKNDFAVDQALKVWEYGPGDKVKLLNRVSVVRTGPGTFKINSNVPCTVKLKAKKALLADSMKGWRLSSSKTDSGQLLLKVAK